MTEMCKYFGLTAVLSWALISPPIALADETLPELPSSRQTYTPFCYLQTPDGRIINLEYLCRPSTNNENGTDSDSGQLQVISYEYKNDSLTGTIVNNTDKLLKQIKVNYEVLDEQGNPIDAGFIDAQPANVPPGGQAVFGGQVAPGASAQPTSLDWSE